MILETLNETLQNFNKNVLLVIPENQKIIVTFLIYFILIALYSIFVWKFYRFLAKRDLIKLNLRQYNKTEHPLLNKLLAIILYIIEYIIIIPALVLFWFVVLSTFLLIISKEQTLAQIILISAAVIGAIRFTAYLSEDLSKDIAKLLPFTMLAIFLITPNLFSFTDLITRISGIPLLFKNIIIYLGIIAAIEIFIRLIYLIIVTFIFKEDPEDIEE
ncbi:hypothetical protein J4216_00255 [Candidatus Woesearchaeota archaeon]|nr:hypothetical protein [Candidatus Woesearchaeota archaeon]